MSAAGKHVVIVGGGDTGADCLGTAVREGAASVTQLDIYPQPGAERDEDAEPWPTYPKIYRLSAAHEEAARSGGRAGRGRGRPAVRRVHAPLRRGTRTGRVRSLHLVEVDARRRPMAGHGADAARRPRAARPRLLRARTGTDGLSTSSGWLWSRAARSPADADFATNVPGRLRGGGRGAAGSR